MKVSLSHGEKVEVILEDSDGMITVSYDLDNNRQLRIETDMPDTMFQREGLIYCEDFSAPPSDIETEPSTHI